MREIARTSGVDQLFVCHAQAAHYQDQHCPSDRPDFPCVQAKVFSHKAAKEGEEDADEEDLSRESDEVWCENACGDTLCRRGSGHVECVGHFGVGIGVVARVVLDGRRRSSLTSSVADGAVEPVTRRFEASQPSTERTGEEEGNEEHCSSVESP